MSQADDLEIMIACSSITEQNEKTRKPETSS